MEKIERQYDQGDTAEQYKKGALKFAAVDPGRKFLRKAAKQVLRSARVIDMGCGDGTDLVALRDMGFVHLSGFDMARKFVEAARGRGLDAVEGSIECVPFPDASVDFVISRFVLMYCRDVGKALEETARVLKPNGILAFVVSNPGADALEQEDAGGNICINLFGGTVTTTFPKHTFSEYLSEKFLCNFTLEKVFEYCGKEQDRGANGRLNALCVLARRKSNRA